VTATLQSPIGRCDRFRRSLANGKRGDQGIGKQQLLPNRDLQKLGARAGCRDDENDQGTVTEMMIETKRGSSVFPLSASVMGQATQNQLLVIG
jgi:hypothetical protein